MLVKFEELEDKVLQNFMGGEGHTDAHMLIDDMGKIMFGKLEPGCSIGKHTHTTNYEVVYILSGRGKALYDDGEEELYPGVCHYCPQYHAHSLINNGTEDLVFFAVVPVR